MERKIQNMTFKTLKNEWNVYFDMQEKVKLAFDENGIEIPFQQIVVHNAEKK